LPPELIKLFEQWPLLILLLFLASPFFVLIGVVITAIVQRLNARGSQRVAEAGVSISETEADTHQFQVIIEGFSKSLEAVSKRADAAEAKAKEAEAVAESAKSKADAAEVKANKLSRRVRSLENQRTDAIEHVLILERLVPNPPGPPERPFWMRTSNPLAITSNDEEWDTEVE